MAWERFPECQRSGRGFSTRANGGRVAGHIPRHKPAVGKAQGHRMRGDHLECGRFLRPQLLGEGRFHQLVARGEFAEPVTAAVRHQAAPAISLGPGTDSETVRMDGPAAAHRSGMRRPDSHGVILGARKKTLSVRRIRHGPDLKLMSAKGSDLVPGAGIKESNRLVAARAGQSQAVWRKGQASDVTRRRTQVGDRFPARPAEDRHPRVVSKRQRLAVRRELHR